MYFVDSDNSDFENQESKSQNSFGGLRSEGEIYQAQQSHNEC